MDFTIAWQGQLVKYMRGKKPIKSDPMETSLPAN